MRQRVSRAKEVNIVERGGEPRRINMARGAIMTTED
jgi:hypothetical protein